MIDLSTPDGKKLIAGVLKQIPTDLKQWLEQRWDGPDGKSPEGSRACVFLLPSNLGFESEFHMEVLAHVMGLVTVFVTKQGYKPGSLVHEQTHRGIETYILAIPAFDAAPAPVPETPKVPETSDPVVNELRREFPEWCTHRHTWMAIGMHRDDRPAVKIFEGAANWYLFGDDTRAFSTAVDAAEHATGLVRLSRRSSR